MDFTIFEGGFGVLLATIVDNPYEYILILLCISALYYFLYRRYVWSIFDPNFMMVFAMVFGVTDVVFMQQNDLMYDRSGVYFLLFVLTELFFYLGFTRYKPLDLLGARGGQISKVRRGLYNYFFCAYSTIFIALQTATIILNGLPVFAGEGVSRLSFYTGGMGAFSIILSSMSVVVLILSVDMLVVRNEGLLLKYLARLDIIYIFINSFGGGAKGGILSIVQILFLYYIFLQINNAGYSSNIVKKAKKMRSAIKCLFVIAVIAVFVVLTLQGSENSLYGLAIRLVGYGDIYALFYYDDFSSWLITDNYVADNLQGLLAAFRFMDYSDVTQGISQQMLQYYAPSNIEVTGRGPNPRHNVLGLVYFGAVGSLVFSFFLGWLASFIRNKMFYKLKKNIFYYIVYIRLLTYATSLPTVGFLNVSLFWFFFINGCILFVLCCIRKAITVDLAATGSKMG